MLNDNVEYKWSSDSRFSGGKMNPGRQTFWYTAGLFWILLIFPLPHFQTHTFIAFWFKRLTRLPGSRRVVPGRRGSWFEGNCFDSSLHFQEDSLFQNTRKIKKIVYNFHPQNFPIQNLIKNPFFFLSFFSDHQYQTSVGLPYPIFIYLFI